LCIFECISVVEVEGVFVRDCRGLWLYTVGTVGLSASGKCIVRRICVVTGWGRMEGEVKDRGKSIYEGIENVVLRKNNGL
jgi:hypothetical protein